MCAQCCTLSIFSKRLETLKKVAVTRCPTDKTVALLTDFLHVGRLYDDCFVIQGMCGFTCSKQCLHHRLTI